METKSDKMCMLWKQFEFQSLTYLDMTTVPLVKCKNEYRYGILRLK